MVRRLHLKSKPLTLQSRPSAPIATHLQAMMGQSIEQFSEVCCGRGSRSWSVHVRKHANLGSFLARCQSTTSMSMHVLGFRVSGSVLKETFSCLCDSYGRQHDDSHSCKDVTYLQAPSLNPICLKPSAHTTLSKLYNWKPMFCTSICIIKMRNSSLFGIAQSPT